MLLGCELTKCKKKKGEKFAYDMYCREIINTAQQVKLMSCSSNQPSTSQRTLAAPQTQP